VSCAPSGAQYEISAGPHRATIVEVGGGIRDYTHDGQPILDGYPPDQMCRGARGSPLIPRPNRLADGAYTFEGTEHQLPLNEPDTRTAIHGLTRWRNWELRDNADDQLTLGLVPHPQPGYPFTLHLTIDYHLREHGLTLTTTATNFGSQRCPYARGQHPLPHRDRSLGYRT
jgi:aldose 1-epimerase